MAKGGLAKNVQPSAAWGLEKNAVTVEDATGGQEAPGAAKEEAFTAATVQVVAWAARPIRPSAMAPGSSAALWTPSSGTNSFPANTRERVCGELAPGAGMGSELTR